MTRLTRLSAPFALLLLAGYASREEPQSKIPPSRRFESSLLHRSHQRTCALTIETEAGAVGTGLSLYLDGNHLARIKAGEAITIYLTPRRHFLSVHPLFSPKVGQRLDLHSGEATTVQIVDRNGNYEFHLVGRGLLWPVHRIGGAWGGQQVTHPPPVE